MCINTIHFLNSKSPSSLPVEVRELLIEPFSKGGKIKKVKINSTSILPPHLIRLVENDTCTRKEEDIPSQTPGAKLLLVPQRKKRKRHGLFCFPLC